jgi:uncharacterized protein YndB with AHSA1/START domain
LITARDLTKRYGDTTAPEQVWEAIATGPGVDSWFTGHTEIEPREGGTNSLDMTDAKSFVPKSTITTRERGKRLAFREDSPDGTFMAFEYLLEGRDDGSTSLRFAHNGILAGDDREAEYDGLKAGDRMYLEQLATYLSAHKGAVGLRWDRPSAGRNTWRHWDAEVDSGFLRLARRQKR